MNHLMVLVWALVSSSAFSHPGHSASPVARSARFVYLEFPANSDKKISIRSIKCDPKKNDLKVQKFSAVKKVVDGEVNVLNIYAQSGECSGSVSSSVWQEQVGLRKNGKASHVYVTILSDNILLPL